MTLAHVCQIGSVGDFALCIRYCQADMTFQCLEAARVALIARHRSEHFQHSQEHTGAAGCVLSNHMEHGVGYSVVLDDGNNQHNALVTKHDSRVQVHRHEIT